MEPNPMQLVKVLDYTGLHVGYAYRMCAKNLEGDRVWVQESKDDTTGQYWLRGVLIFLDE
jgi:hypothetical protein